MMADSVFSGIGGSGKQSAGAAIPNIGSTSDNEVAQDRPAPTADGEPVSPSLAARRYGAAAGQGYAGNGDPGSP